MGVLGLEDIEAGTFMETKRAAGDAAKFNVDRVKQEDVAKSSGGPAEEE